MSNLISIFKKNKGSILGYGLIATWIFVCLMIYMIFGNS